MSEVVEDVEDSTTLKAVEEEKPQEKESETWQTKLFKQQNMILKSLTSIVTKITPAEEAQPAQEIPAPPEKAQESNQESEQSRKEGRHWLQQIW